MARMFSNFGFSFGTMWPRRWYLKRSTPLDDARTYAAANPEDDQAEQSVIEQERREERGY